MPDETGQLARLNATLGERYRIERELGRGGMATVYLAEDLKHHRLVAIKVLHPDLAAALGPGRFLREIEVTARLNHPHILPLLDSGGATGLLYYVMPYVEGESLRERLRREKQLPLDDALQIAREVADALSYAHSHDVLHRDVKPENILLASGHAVVADFGIARAITTAGSGRLTDAGMALGTPAYMSPEQASGDENLDGRSDMYALGCVLYEMLAGRPPFVGVTQENVLHQHLTLEPPSVTALRPAVPTWVASALERALAKTPADRFNPVALFAEAIAPRPSAGSAAGRPGRLGVGSRHIRWRTWRPISVGVVVVLLAAIAVHQRLRARVPAVGTRTTVAVLPFQNLSEGSYAYFAGGLHEELLTQLANVAALQVISRTSVMEYATHTKPLKEIARELHAGTIVEGSVQVVADRLRVNVQLIDAATDEHLWAQRYDRTLDDAFAVQSDIAQRIVEAVGVALTELEARAVAAPPTENAEAYRLYLQGEEYRTRPGGLRQNLEFAQALYERAVALDSTFALAYASLSVVAGYERWFGYDVDPGRLERQRNAAQTALRLAPNLPQVHWAMGFLHYQSENDYAAALREFTLALERQPGSAELWASIGYAHRRLAHWDETLEAFARARALNPRDADLLGDLGGNTLEFLHRYAGAIALQKEAYELAPDAAGSLLATARMYFKWRGELDSLRNTLARGPDDYGPAGSATLWRIRLGLLQHEPERILALLGDPDTVVLENQGGYEPGQLYAGWAYQLRNDSGAAIVAFRSGLVQLDSALRRRPGETPLHASRGLALAGARRETEAMAEVEWLRRSIARMGPYDRPAYREPLAMIFAQLGLAREAVAELEPLLAGPSFVSVHELRLDPRYDPIRHDPRFQALLAKYANPQPVRLAPQHSAGNAG